MRVLCAWTAFCLACLILLSSSEEAKAQQPPAQTQTGCRALDKEKPPLFISYAGADDKAWDGERYVKGVLLRINNNSNCALTLTAEYGESVSPSVRTAIKGGKPTRPAALEEAALLNGQRVSLYYLMKYPNERDMIVGGFGGDVLETTRLCGGDYILISVPLKNFKRDGELLVPFNYEWDAGAGSRLKAADGDYGLQAVQHYLSFRKELLPPAMLK